MIILTIAVYCDYYNEQGQCRWHYEACGQIQTCSNQGEIITHKLEGNYSFSVVLKYDS